MVLEYLQIRNKLVQAFAFQPVRHESGIFRFECMKACLRLSLKCGTGNLGMGMENGERGTGTGNL